MEGEEIDQDILLAIQLSLEGMEGGEEIAEEFNFGAVPEESEEDNYDEEICASLQEVADIVNEEPEAAQEEEKIKISEEKEEEVAKEVIDETEVPKPVEIEEKKTFLTSLVASLTGDKVFDNASDIHEEIFPLYSFLQGFEDSLFDTVDDCLFICKVIDVIMISIKKSPEFNAIFNSPQKYFFTQFYSSTISFCIRGIEHVFCGLSQEEKAEHKTYDLLYQFIELLENICVTGKKNSLSKKKTALSYLDIPLLSLLDEKKVKDEKEECESGFISLLGALPEIEESAEALTRLSLPAQNCSIFTKDYNGVARFLSLVPEDGSAQCLPSVSLLFTFLLSLPLSCATSLSKDQRNLFGQSITSFCVAIMNDGKEKANPLLFPVVWKAVDIMHRYISTALSLHVECVAAREVLCRSMPSDALEIVLKKEIDSFQCLFLPLNDLSLALGTLEYIFNRQQPLRSLDLQGSASYASFDLFSSKTLAELKEFLLATSWLSTILICFLASYKQAVLLTKVEESDKNDNEDVSSLFSMFKTPPATKKRKTKKNKSKTNAACLTESTNDLYSTTDPREITKVNLKSAQILYKIIQSEDAAVGAWIRDNLSMKDIELLLRFFEYQSPKVSVSITLDGESKVQQGPLLQMNQAQSVISGIVYYLFQKKLVRAELNSAILSFFSLGSEAFSLSIPELHFSVLSRLVLNSCVGGDTSCANSIWSKVLFSLSQELAHTSDPDYVLRDILSPVYLQFLFGLFHIQGEAERCLLFSSLVDLLHSQSSNSLSRSLFALSRLVSMIHYLSVFFDSPSKGVRENFEYLLNGKLLDFSDDMDTDDLSFIHFDKDMGPLSPIADAILEEVAEDQFNRLLLLSPCLGNESNHVYPYYLRSVWHFIHTLPQLNVTPAKKGLNNELLPYFVWILRNSFDCLKESSEVEIDLVKHLEASLEVVGELTKKFASKETSSSPLFPIAHLLIDFFHTVCLSCGKETKESSSAQFFVNAPSNSVSAAATATASTFLLGNYNIVLDALLKLLQSFAVQYEAMKSAALSKREDLKELLPVVLPLSSTLSTTDLESLCTPILDKESLQLLLRWSSCAEGPLLPSTITIPSDRIESVFFDAIALGEIASVQSMVQYLVLLVKEILLLRPDSFSFDESLLVAPFQSLVDKTPFIDAEACKFLCATASSSDKEEEFHRSAFDCQMNCLSLLSSHNLMEKECAYPAICSIVEFITSALTREQNASGRSQNPPIASLLRVFMTTSNEKVHNTLSSFFMLLLEKQKFSNLILSFLDTLPEETIRSWLILHLLQKNSSKTFNNTRAFIRAVLAQQNISILPTCLTLFDVAFNTYPETAGRFFEFLQNLCWDNKASTQLLDKICSFLLSQDFATNIESSTIHKSQALLFSNFIRDCLIVVAPQKPKEVEQQSALSEEKKLCTFATTNKDFTKQHWYYCYTCGLSSGVGLCSVCLYSCHKDHDTSYAQFSSFFCDCGAGEESKVPCKCLVVPYAKPVVIPELVSSIPKVVNNETKDQLLAYFQSEEAGKKLISIYKQWLSAFQSSSTSLLDPIKPQISMNEKDIDSSMNLISLKRVLKTTFKVGSGSFDYDAEHGQQLKSLNKSNSIRKNLIDINAEKVIAVAQLNAVVLGKSSKLFENGKNALSDKHYQQTDSASLTFHPLYVSFNPKNSQYLAVAGIKDCLIMTINEKGSVSDQLFIDLSLEALADNLYIKGVMWVPGSEVKLALITNQFVKIFDLSKDVISPLHYFSLIEDNVCDVSFLTEKADGTMFILLLAESGMLFCQPLAMNEGPCILTDVVQIDNCLTGKESYSVHYSPVLELVFVSYKDGKSFAGKLDNAHSSFLWTFKLSKPSEVDAYHSWVDVAAQPGVILCVNKKDMIIAMSFFKDSLKVQAMSLSDKVEGLTLCKSSVVAVAIVGDGSLNSITMVTPKSKDGATPISAVTKEKLLAFFDEKKSKREGEARGEGGVPPAFSAPLDYFEKVKRISDSVRYSGPILKNESSEDVQRKLTSHNPNDHVVIRNRAVEPLELVIDNTLSDLAIAGVRVMTGVASSKYVPKEISVLGRTLSCKKEHRWYEFPFSPAERLKASSSVSIYFKGTLNNSKAFVIDRVEVYGVEKDTLDWKHSSTPSTTSSPLENALLLMSDSIFDCATLSGSDKEEYRCLAELLPHLLAKPEYGRLYTALESLLISVQKDGDTQGSLKDTVQLNFLACKVAQDKDLDATTFAKAMDIMKEIAMNRPESISKLVVSCPSFPQDVADQFWQFLSSEGETWKAMDSVVSACAILLFRYLSDVCTEGKSVERVFALITPFLASTRDSVRDSFVHSLTQYWSSTVESLHIGYYNCDGCENVIVESRWHCEECEDYDLCDKCHSHPETITFDDHKPEHSMALTEEICVPNQETESKLPAPSPVVTLTPSDDMTEDELLEMAVRMSLSGDSVPTEVAHRSGDAAIFDWLLIQFQDASQKGGKEVLPIGRLLHSLCLQSIYDPSELKRRLSKLISTLVSPSLGTEVTQRTPLLEVNIIILKLIAALIRDPRSKSQTYQVAVTSRVALLALKKTDIISSLYNIINASFSDPVAKKSVEKEENSHGALLKPNQTSVEKDLFPFFPKPYVKKNSDLFADHSKLLVESSLKLLSLLFKDESKSENQKELPLWAPLLCKYINTPRTEYEAKKSKSVLRTLCHSKPAYYTTRDFSQFESLSKKMVAFHDSSNQFRDELSYSDNVSLVKCIDSMWNSASCRPAHWQFFLAKNESFLRLLLKAIFFLNEEPMILSLKLISYAFLPSTLFEEALPATSLAQMDMDQVTNMPSELIDSLFTAKAMSRLIKVFLLEYNTSAVRKEMRNLFHWMCFQAPPSLKETLFQLLTDRIEQLPTYGRNSGEFFELFAFVTNTVKQSATPEVFEKLLNALKQQNALLSHHPNSYLYEALSGLVRFDGYYLESEPCVVCNDPEMPYNGKSLRELVADTKYTANTMIHQFAESYSVQQLVIEISNIRKSKMIKTIHLYYNNKPVQNISELKGNWNLWKRIKTCELAPGQRILTVDFVVPITACNFLIEFYDLYENLQLQAKEILQCPRCNSVVTDKHGICDNCQENAYQCSQCRNLNYGHFTAILCNECGFCKYASFSISAKAKVSFATNKIENDEERDIAEKRVDKESEKAYDYYMDVMKQKKPISELVLEIKSDTAKDKAGDYVHSSISDLGSLYASSCRKSFSSLSKSMQILLGARRELVRYNQRGLAKVDAADTCDRPNNRCYGCANAFISLSLSLVETLSQSPDMQEKVVRSGTLTELMSSNLLQGTAQNRAEARKVICSLVKDDSNATSMLSDFLWNKFEYALANYRSIDISGFIKNEIQLLVETAAIQDSCWESRLQLLLKVFFCSLEKMASPVIVNQLVLPCLTYLSTITAPTKSSTSEYVKVIPPSGFPTIQYSKWSKEPISFAEWKKEAETIFIGDTEPIKEAEREEQMKEEEEPLNGEEMPLPSLASRKYIAKWKKLAGVSTDRLQLSENWLITLLFCDTSIAVRERAATVIEHLCCSPKRKRSFLFALYDQISAVPAAGENAREYFELFSSMIDSNESKVALTLRGFLQKITQAISLEIERIQKLERTLTSDVSQGYVLNEFINLLSSFLEMPGIRRKFKSDQLMVTLLDGFLSIRGIIVQKTKLTDESSDKLISLLTSLHGSNEEDNQLFIVACIKALDNHNSGRTPLFIFEQIRNIVCPTVEEPEFLMNITKSPTQEDFIRDMKRNPYSSKDDSIGPLMRDVKNKICKDLELHGFLEIDSGIELIVCGKILSLDLTSKQVFEKVWMKELSVTAVEDAAPMEIMYRLQGLDGEATEDIVETLGDGSNEEVDPEEEYKVTAVMSECGGLEKMLFHLEGIKDFVREKDLANQVLDLLVTCCKIRVNRKKLLELHSVGLFLEKLKLVFPRESQADIAESLLLIVESLVSEANAGEENHQKLRTSLEATHNDTEEAASQMCMFLEKLGSPLVRCNTKIVNSVTRILPVLTYGHDSISESLAMFFIPFLTFDKFDTSHFDDETYLFHLDCFVSVSTSVRQDVNGMKLRDVFEKLQVTSGLYSYLSAHIPREEEEEEAWKEFTERKSLIYVLPALSGLTKGHASTQQKVLDENIIVGLYRLSGMSTKNKLGNFAEALLESLAFNNDMVRKAIEDVKTEAEGKKKEIANAARQRILDQMNMQVEPSTSASVGIISVTNFDCFEDLEDEVFSCKICREGFLYMPTEILGFYVFTKVTSLTDFGSRRDLVYSTVSNFNLIHLSCHNTAAAADAKLKKEEWEGAMLRNSSTLCNNIFPVRGPEISEEQYGAKVDSYWATLSMCGRCDSPRVSLLAHDVKLLVLRYATSSSFSEDSRGGGRESNISMIPFFLQMGFFLLDQSDSSQRKMAEQALAQYLSCDKNLWAKSAFKKENSFYACILSLFLHSKEEWNHWKSYFFERILFDALMEKTSEEERKELSLDSLFALTSHGVYFFVMVDLLQNVLKSDSSGPFSSEPQCSHAKNDDWIVQLNNSITSTPADIIEVAKKALFDFDALSTHSSFPPFYEHFGFPDNRIVLLQQAKDSC